MQTALGQRWLGAIFSVLIIFTYALGFNALASYNLQSTFVGFDFYNPAVTPAVMGIALAILFLVCILGGGKRLAKVTGAMVPVMGVIYIAVAFIIVVLNLGKMPAVFGRIFASAFDFKAIFGGFSGSCLMYGIKRGLYSNEAGMGSAPNAAAAADVSHPVKQGLVQMLSVFIDTLLVCSATAFMCLTSDVVPTAELAGAPYVQAALKSSLGAIGPIFIAVSMTLFAFTTLLGNYYYCEGCLRFILKRQPGKTFMTGFRVVAAFIVFVGALACMQLVWDLADLTQGLMVITNIPVILLLGKPAVAALKDYRKQKAAGKNPVFKAADIGLEGKTEFWQ